MSVLVIIALLVVLAAAAYAGYAYGARGRDGSSGSAEPRTPVSAPTLPGPMTPDSTSQAAEMERVGSEKARLIRSRDAEAAMLRQSLAESGALPADARESHEERERLNADLADARRESARYRQLVVDIENNAPPPILSGAGEPDDLKLIVGIGPVLERMLHNLGVTTFRQIAHWSERDSAEFDARLPEFPGRIVRDQWVTQARELHQAKFGEPPSDRPRRA